jgi:hypothetical protein
LWVAVAAFCFTSSVFIHLVSAVVVLPVVGYAWFSLRFEKLGRESLRGSHALWLPAQSYVNCCMAC